MSVVKPSATEIWFRHEVLNKRCLAVVAWSFVIQSCLLWAIKLINISISSIFGLRHIDTITIIYCEIYLAFLVLGLSILFLKNVRVYPQLSLSPLSSLSCVFRPQSWFHGLSFLSLTALWAQCLLSVLGDPGHASLWKQTPACLSESAVCCVSEHHVFIVLFGAFVGFSFCLSYQTKHLYCLRFEIVQQLKLVSVKAKVRGQIRNSIIEVTRSVRNFYLLYFFFGFLPKWFLSNILYQSFCDQESLTSLRSLVDLRLLWTTFIVGAIIHTSFSVTLSLVQVFLTENYSFPVEADFEKDNVCLLTKAIFPENSDLLQYLSLQSLSFISQNSSACRKKIFAISVPGGHPHSWNLISSRCLQIVEEFQIKLGEAAITTSCIQIPASTQVSTANGNAGTAPALQTPMKPLEAVGTPNLRSTFKGRNMADSGTSPQSYYTSKPAEPLIKFEKVFHVKVWLTQAARKALDNMMNKSPVKFLILEQSERKLEKLFCSCRLVIWSIQSLCFLVRASYSEDRHGVVQWSLPKIISTLLNLQLALERTPKGLLRSTNSRDLWSTPPKVLCLKPSLRAALNSGLYHIACTFKEHLKYIELSEDHRNRMERYLQMKE